MFWTRFFAPAPESKSAAREHPNTVFAQFFAVIAKVEAARARKGRRARRGSALPDTPNQESALPSAPSGG